MQHTEDADTSRLALLGQVQDKQPLVPVPGRTQEAEKCDLKQCRFHFIGTTYNKLRVMRVSTTRRLYQAAIGRIMCNHARSGGSQTVAAIDKK